MREIKGFTLLELLLVVSLTLIVFGVVGFSFVNFFRGNVELSAQINKTVSHLSVYNQLSRQLFSIYTGKAENIKIDGNRISFYTYYPVFFEGAVRAEYYIKEEKGKKLLYYEEYPYVDGKLGHPGLKKAVLGVFQFLEFEPYYGGSFKDRYTGKKPPEAIRINFKENQYIITVWR
ncbi:hypothetical protein [Persephonella sp.]